MYRRQIGCLIGMVILLAWVSVTLAGTVPEEARRFMTRGMAAVEMAKTPKDYERAVREFEQAAKLAPNWPDVYFNLGSVQVKAGNYGEAMRNYKRYLELAPNASDAAKVREELYKIEYRAEQQEEVTVTDNKTGLMWQKRDDNKQYNWYQASGTYHAEYNPTSQNVCASLNLGGYSDWRLPEKDELVSILNRSISSHGPKINVTDFPNTKSSGYWTSTTVADKPEGAWVVLFGDGLVSEWGKYFTNGGMYVRCVRR